MNKARCIAIVDGYSSGAMFPEYFSKEGVACVHVQSTRQIPDVYRGSFNPEDYAANIVHSGNLEETLETLSLLEPEQVIAGIESGVELADQLSEAMGKTTNGTRLSLARRDKYEMIKALQVAGVRTALSFNSKSLPETLEWVSQNLDFPVVVKPPKSAGTDNVTICHSEQEIETAFHAILGQKNRLDLINESVLVQEFLVGKEYIVDSVTFNGRNVVCAYQESNKIHHEGAMVYENCRSVPFQSPEAKTLYPYVCDVLRALEINWGPSHMELILTASGPVLIEVGARLDGCRAPESLRKAILVDQVQLSVDCYLNPQTSYHKWGTFPFQVHKYNIRVFLISDAEGMFLGYGHNERIRQLPSFNKFTSLLSVGAPMVKTTNLFNTPGYIDLFHEDAALLEENYQQIRKWEKEPNFYIVQNDNSESAERGYQQIAQHVN